MKKIIVFFLFLPVICLGQSDLENGLIASYPFNGDAQDQSGNNNHGEVVGALPTTDRYGTENAAYEFDGESSYITVPNSESLQSPTTELTQVAWINIYSWSLIGAQFGPILMKSNTSANSLQYRLSVGSTGVNTAIGNWDNAVTIMDTLHFEEWFMVASTLKDDTVRAYVNGNYIGSGTLSGPVTLYEYPLEIGRDIPGSNEVFHGKIDDIRIYNRALSDEEIQELFDYHSGIDQNSWINSSQIKIYPNPFTSNTTIQYGLTHPEIVRIEFYNQLGKLVDVIEQKQAAGNQQVVWDAEGLPAGVYFCVLKTENRTKTSKIIKL